MMGMQKSSGMAEVSNSLDFWHSRGNMKVTNLPVFEEIHYLKIKTIQVDYQPGA